MWQKRTFDARLNNPSYTKTALILNHTRPATKPAPNSTAQCTVPLPSQKDSIDHFHLKTLQIDELFNIIKRYSLWNSVTMWAP